MRHPDDPVRHDDILSVLHPGPQDAYNPLGGPSDATQLRLGSSTSLPSQGNISGPNVSCAVLSIQIHTPILDRHWVCFHPLPSMMTTWSPPRTMITGGSTMTVMSLRRCLSRFLVNLVRMAWVKTRPQDLFSPMSFLAGGMIFPSRGPIFLGRSSRSQLECKTKSPAELFHPRVHPERDKVDTVQSDLHFRIHH